MNKLKVWGYRALALVGLLTWLYELNKLVGAGDAEHWGAVIYRAILAIFCWLATAHWWGCAKRQARKNKSECEGCK